MVFAPTPDVLASASGRTLALPDAARDGADGRYAILRAGVLTQVVLLAGTTAGDPSAALMPLDDDLPGRMEALLRFWRGLCGLPLPRDTRMTVHQRRRLRLMLQATDGRGHGASYREIATALYDRERVASEPWKTSSLRDGVIGLARGGAAMVAGGYRQLLRHRRRR